MKIKPEHVRAHLADKSSAVRASGSPAGRASARSAPAARRDRDVDGVLKSISASYFFLRWGLAALAFVLPILLWLGGGVDHLQPSLSAYYHFHVTADGSPSPYGSGTMRDVFVGVSCVTGAILFFYKGYSWKEDWALNVAGVAAVLVAIFPMDWPVKAGSVSANIHSTSAIVYFVAVAVVCLFLSGDTLRELKDEEQKRRFKRAYAVLGTLMLALPLGLLLLHQITDRFDAMPLQQGDKSYVTLAMEVAANWVFAIFWMVKSLEIALIEKQRLPAGEPSRTAS